jgi:hypothetical protein
VTFHQETATFGDYIPCVTEFPSLAGFEITITFNGVEHFNENKNGGHFTLTNTGTFSAEPVLFADANADGEPDFDEATESFVIAGPRAGESFSGRFTQWGGGNFNRSGIVATTFTFSGHGTGDEGHRLELERCRPHHVCGRPVRRPCRDHQSRLQPVQLSLNDREAAGQCVILPGCLGRSNSWTSPSA